MSTVTSLADSGIGSLRAAIATATPGDTITFDASLAGGTITLSNPLEINQNLTLDGSGASGLTLNGNNSTRIITVSGIGTQVNINRLIFRNGRAVQDNGAGGAIKTSNQAQLTVSASQFIDNVATDRGGGAIWTGYQSTTTILDSEFQGNQTLDPDSERGGGAIASSSEGNLTVRDSLFNNNRGVNGGAINSLLGDLTIENSTFTNNTAIAGSGPINGKGGAVFTDGASATIDNTTQGNIEIRNSRFDSNQGDGEGGGLYLYAYPGDSVTVEQNTIVNNRVNLDSNNWALGGGLRLGGSANFVVRDTTILNNYSESQGGGLWSGENSPLEIVNSVIWGNEAISPNASPGLGGGIVITGNPAVAIRQSTIANNVASFRGGGFWGGGTNLILSDSLVADNRIQDAFNTTNQTGEQFGEGGGNFQSLQPNPGDTKVTSGVTLLDPQLGTLVDNGTAMQTPPQAGNPLVTGGATAAAVPGTIPASPSNLQAIADGDGIQLSWQDNSNNETEFVLERSTDGTNWTAIANLAANITEYRDTNLAANATYVYRLQAANGLGSSALVASDAVAFSAAPAPNPGGEPATPNPGQTVPPLAEKQPGIFELGEPTSTVNLQISLKASPTSLVHELGVFVVDDEQGTVQGLTPQATGYFEAALENSTIVFSALPQDTFPQFTYARQLSLTGGERIAFYLVRDRTTEQVLQSRDFSAVLYSTNAVQVTQAGEALLLAWEDGLGTRDFQDLQIEVSVNTQTPPVTTTWQGQQQGELLDLRSFSGTISLAIATASSAAYQNSYGLYIVDDPLTGQVGSLRPGDAGYARAAIAQRVDFSQLSGGSVLAPFLIANGTIEEFLEQNPDNAIGEAIAYFPYLGANPDGEDHVRLLGDNLFGFEDLLNGGDRDYNDLVMQITVNG